MAVLKKMYLGRLRVSWQVTVVNSVRINNVIHSILDFIPSLGARRCFRLRIGKLMNQFGFQLCGSE